MSKTYTIDLNKSQSLNDAINKFVAASKDIQEGVERAIEILCAEGERKAKELCPAPSEAHPFATGELRDSITHKVELNGKKTVGTITAGTDHALFVEFGTGVVGAGSPHPDIFSGWEYDVNGHGSKGWYYPKGDRVFHTKGQKSNPFMYETAKYLSENAERILSEHIS